MTTISTDALPPRRPLGRSGLEVSAIGLGCMGMSDFYGAASDADSEALIRYALDQGMNFFDTADMYGPHTNERLLGRALAGRRDEAVIATKFGVRRSAEGAFLGISGRPEYVQACCDASLQRLGVDTIDLYYQHRVDPEVPIEETVGAMAALVAAGKVRFLGLSEATDEQLRRAAAVHPITALQTELSLWSRDPEVSLLDTCAALGTSFVAYSPLGRGFLAGRWQRAEDIPEGDYRRQSPRFRGENFDANLAIVEVIRQIAADAGCTPAQIALAWVLGAGEQVVTIPGTTKRHRFDENLAAARITLSAEERARLSELIPVGAAQGTRY